MDSDDDAEDGEDEKVKAQRATSASASRSRSSGRFARRAPLKAPDEVQLLSEMMRLAESWTRATVLRKPLAELASICRAAARVKYYDGSIFGDVNAAIKQQLRACRGPPKAEDLAGVVFSLAEINAYDKGVWDAISSGLDMHGGAIEMPWRTQIIMAFRKYNHDMMTPALQLMIQWDKQSRYEAACDEVKTSWQSASNNKPIQAMMMRT